MIFPIEIFDKIDTYLDLSTKVALRSTCRTLETFRFGHLRTRTVVNKVVRLENAFATRPKPCRMGAHFNIRLLPSTMVYTRTLFLTMSSRPSVGEIGIMEKVLTEKDWFWSRSNEDTKYSQVWNGGTGLIDAFELLQLAQRELGDTEY